MKLIFSDYALKRIAQSAANGTLSDTVNWLNQHVGQPYVHHEVIAAATARLAEQNPRETFRWLEGVNTTLLRTGDTSTAGYRVLLESWKARDGAQVVETWLQAQSSHSHYDHLAWQYAALVAEQDPNAAMRWANTIKDPAIKQDVVQMIKRHVP